MTRLVANGNLVLRLRCEADKTGDPLMTEAADALEQAELTIARLQDVLNSTTVEPPVVAGRMDSKWT